jgi:hypothetical protein
MGTIIIIIVIIINIVNNYYKLIKIKIYNLHLMKTIQFKNIKADHNK